MSGCVYLTVMHEWRWATRVFDGPGQVCLLSTFKAAPANGSLLIP